ncbi:hypothetical protein COT72_02860 [archaeon CG10_big_fil_rev_8_21_14_0_10_43_11]|nr:MAG: hypothetical protein COT72_02860 [archaeon CG10_big_fil_rev_8_21_14_0_10_43_11]
MVKVIFCAWIPRSYLHVYEVGRKAMHIPLTISNIQLLDNVTFHVKDVDFDADFSLNGDGLYTLSTTIEEALVEDFLIKAENILLHKIIKTCHSVTYQQILNKALPLTKINIYIGTKGTYYNKQDPYQQGARIFVKAKPTKATQKSALFHAQGLLFSQFLHLMMERMEKLYKNANKISSLLEKEVKLNDIKRAVFGMDLVKKNVAESYEKIEQMATIFAHKKEQVESEKEDMITRALDTHKLYTKIVSDQEYIKGLWSLLIAFLDNLDAAAEARLSYQETLESRTIETILGGEVAIALAVVIVGIFFSNQVGFAGIVTLVTVFLVWLLLRRILSEVHTRIGRVRKIANE